MIDVRDLSVGNLLCYKGNPAIWFEVDEIHSRQGGIVYSAGSDVMKRAYDEKIDLYKNWFRPEELTGIPITPEWLEKLGFEWIEKDYGVMSYKWLECDSTDYFITAYTKPMAFEIDAPNLFTEIRIDDCKHVHELQNIVYWNCRKHELTLNSAGGEE